jgi:hypothetical protein
MLNVALGTAAKWTGISTFSAEAFKTVHDLQLKLHSHRDWRDIMPVKPYAAYIQERYVSFEAERIIKQSDAERVARFDICVGLINACIGRRVTNVVHIRELEGLIRELRMVAFGGPMSPA